MEQIINQLLSTSSTVIFPHFGAVMKIGEGYQFNEFLKYNDGKLVAAVEENKNVSKDEANEIVSDYIRSIKEHLNSNKAFELGSIGSFSKKSDKIVLLSASSSKPSASKKALPKEPKTEEAVENKKKPVEKVKQETIEKKVEMVKEDLPKVYTSTNLVLDRAIEKIQSIKNIKELEAFAKGETREKVLTAINNKKELLLKPKEAKTPVIEKPKVTPVITEEKKSLDTEKKETTKTQKQAEDHKIKNEKKIAEPIVTEKERIAKAASIVSDNTKHENKKVLKTSPTENKKTETKLSAEKEENKIEKELMAGAIVIEKEAKKRKRNRLILWAAILLLLVGTSIIGYLKKNEILSLINTTQVAENVTTENNELEDVPLKNSTNDTKQEAQSIGDPVLSEEELKEQEENSTEELFEEVKEETPAAKETIEEEQVEELIEEVKPTETKGKYNIIVGSFSSEENATNLVSKLKNEGFTNALLLGKYGGLHTVSIDNYSSRNDAKSALSNIEEKGYSGWIKKI